MFIAGAPYTCAHTGVPGAAAICALHSSSCHSGGLWCFSDFEVGFDEMLIFGVLTIVKRVNSENFFLVASMASQKCWLGQNFGNHASQPLAPKKK